MSQSAKLQVVVSPEVLEVLDDHVERLNRLQRHSALHLPLHNRASVARDWLAFAYPYMEARLRDMESAQRQSALYVRDPDVALPPTKRQGRPPRKR